MTRKFKLIKTYPGFYKLGIVLYQIKDKFNNYWDIDTIKDVKKEFVGNNPEFWEEVIEKDYEIIDFINYPVNKCYGGWYAGAAQEGINSIKNEEWMLRLYEIKSVKRL